MAQQQKYSKLASSEWILHSYSLSLAKKITQVTGRRSPMAMASRHRACLMAGEPRTRTQPSRRASPESSNAALSFVGIEICQSAIGRNVRLVALAFSMPNVNMTITHIGGFLANDKTIQREFSQWAVCKYSVTQPNCQTTAHFNTKTMNSPTASSTSSSMDDISTTTPIFQVQNDFDDELQLHFAPPTGDAPIYVAGDVASPVTQYRDAPFQFTTASLDRFEELDNFSLYSGKHQPAMELDLTPFSKQKQLAASPLSPSTAVEIPVKEGWDSFFGSAFPSFPSFADPETIMATLQNALKPFECSVRVENQWTLRVSWLCVAEEIAFSISLSKEQGSEEKDEVAFRREFGDEMAFHQLVECIRARCSDIDAEPLLFADSTLEPWLDAKQELKGRRYAIRDTEAAQLIKEMNADLDVDTLYEVAKMVKNHCRHRGNRRLFLESDRSGFVQAIKWMLADSEVLARFAAFILLQYAKESCDGESVELFSSAFERNSVEMLLSELECRESDSACSQFTIAMLAEIQQSRIFA
ncbi:hypothetical protein PI124_g3913 [Phytophthora idaei]|nr:hypothetical protein PI126_g3386 [Phytophthora idaei]KAG3251462.1 hypothetical protein PI124_g3913 [Phytophthora idaei]